MVYLVMSGTDEYCEIELCWGLDGRIVWLLHLGRFLLVNVFWVFFWENLTVFQIENKKTK